MARRIVSPVNFTSSTASTKACRRTTVLTAAGSPLRRSGEEWAPASAKSVLRSELPEWYDSAGIAVNCENHYEEGRAGHPPLHWIRYLFLAAVRGDSISSIARVVRQLAAGPPAHGRTANLNAAPHQGSCVF